MSQIVTNISTYLLHMSSQYGELRPTNGWDRLASLWDPSKFQRVSRLCFVTAPTSLNGGQPNFARCLAVSWTCTLYRHIYTFWGFCLLTEFCQVQRSLCVQVFRSSILTALQHGAGAVGLSHTLRHDIFTQKGGHPVPHWAVELSSLVCLDKACN